MVEFERKNVVYWVVCVFEGEGWSEDIELPFHFLLFVPDSHHVLQLADRRGVEQSRVEDLAGVGEVPYLHRVVPPWNGVIFLDAFALEGALLVDGLAKLFLVLSHDVLKPGIDVNCSISQYFFLLLLFFFVILFYFTSNVHIA